jgi:hypothetical protein
MMIIRLSSYLLILILALEALAMSAVAWSFYESVNSSLSLLKYTSDNKARDILSTVARVAESKMSPDGNSEMNEFFAKLIKQSEKDLDKFLIKEIFLVSNDGTLLSHSDTEELRNSSNSSFNKPQYMRALRMRKGQLPTPQVIGDEYLGDNTIFGTWIMKTFPDLKYQTILLSSPVYHTQRLEAIASIHLVYNRGNVLFFINNQREIFSWMLTNYSIIALIIAFGLWIVFALYNFASYRQGARVATHSESAPPTSSKIGAILEKQEDTLKKYLTPIPARMDSDISLNILDQTEHNIESPEAIHLETEEKEITKKTVPVSSNGKKNLNENPDPKKTEAIDAIFLD